MLNDALGSASSARLTCAWYSHVTQNPRASHESWGPSEKCAVKRRVWYRHCSADAAKQVLPLLVRPAGSWPRRLSSDSCQEARMSRTRA